MGNQIINIGEGICFFGIMLAVAITNNYWLLFFLIVPIYTWASIDTKIRNKGNELYYEKENLQIDKLREELRLLKLKKK